MTPTSKTSLTVQKLWPFIIIFGLWFFFACPYFLKGLVPFPSTYLVTFFPPWNASYGMPVKNNAMPDVISQIYPWKLVTINSWKNGEIPLWNPYSFSGTPLAANYQSAVFNPCNLLYAVINFIDAWSIQILLQPLLAGLFAYLFLRSIGKSYSASIIAAVGWMFSGFITTWMAYGTLGYAVLYLPFILLAVVRENQKHHWSNAVMIAIGIALSFMSGHFQISLYVTGASILFICFKAISTRKISLNVRLFLYVLFGLLLTLPQLVLTYKSYLASTRVTSIIMGEIIPWQYLITFFSPDYYGNPVTRNDWFGHYAEWAGYIGVIPLILAVFSLTQKVKGYKKFFLGLFITSLLFAYRSPLSYLLFVLKIPVLSTSAASRIIVLSSFSLSVLAAFGFDDIVLLWNTQNRKKILSLIVPVAIIVAGLWICTLFIKFPSPDGIAIAKRNLILPSVFAGAAIGSILLGLLRNRWIRFFAISMLVALGMFDAFRYASKWVPFEPKNYVYPETQMATYLKSHAGFDRVFGNFGNEFGSTNAIQLIEGYDAMYQGRYATFINASNNGKPEPGARSVVSINKNGNFTDTIFQLLGVRYIVHRKSDARNIWAYPYWKRPAGDFELIYSDDSYWIYEYKKAFPRVFLASGYVVQNNDEQMLKTLFSDDFNRTDTLILEKTPVIEPKEGTGSAQIISYKPNEVRVKVNSTVPKLLFLSDVYDSGWKATVDGIKTQIYRADYDFRAVSIPKGDHSVRFYYLPDEFIWGIVISGLSILGIIVLSVHKI